MFFSTDMHYQYTERCADAACTRPGQSCWASITGKLRRLHGFRLIQLRRPILGTVMLSWWATTSVLMNLRASRGK